MNVPRLLLLTAVCCTGVVTAQEQSPASSPSPTPTPAPTAAPSRSARISFVPPPLDGTITLGIYDRDGKLVRTLVQEGAVDEFDVGADALNAKWDGKNDRDEDSPPGKYHARGFMVGHLKVEDVGPAASPTPDLTGDERATIKLVPNPLSKNAKPTIELTVGFDEEEILLKTTDGLPLFSVIEAPALVRVGLTKEGEKSVSLWAQSDSAIEQVRVSNLDQIMAFDCGDIELK
jgi:hypothetical protein